MIELEVFTLRIAKASIPIVRSVHMFLEDPSAALSSTLCLVTGAGNLADPCKQQSDMAKRVHDRFCAGTLAVVVVALDADNAVTMATLATLVTGYAAYAVYAAYPDFAPVDQREHKACQSTH